MRRPIANNSRPGQVIYDPFLGSGTSVIAAEMTGRVCYGLELNPAYVDVIVCRWQLFTGRAASHQASGQSFDDRTARLDHDPSGAQMARSAFLVTEALREKVRHLAGLGVPQDDIAKIVGCAPKTLRKRFRDELDRGIAEANATVAGYLFNQAKANNTTAIIFWLKTRARWREQGAAQEPPSAADGRPHVEILLLPDNTRDPELTKALREAQEKHFAAKRQRQQPQ